MEKRRKKNRKLGTEAQFRSAALNFGNILNMVKTLPHIPRPSPHRIPWQFFQTKKNKSYGHECITECQTCDDLAQAAEGAQDISGSRALGPGCL